MSNREIIKEKILELIVEALTEVLPDQPAAPTLTYYADLQKPETVGTVTLHEQQTADFEKSQYDCAWRMLAAPELQEAFPQAFTLTGRLAVLISIYKEARQHIGELEAALQTSRELCDSIRSDDERVREELKSCRECCDSLRGGLGLT